jgi:hypothetical protein
MALDEFNQFYSRFLRELHQAFNGKPDLFVEAIPRMYKLKYMAQALCAIPMATGQETLGPSWEWMPE